MARSVQLLTGYGSRYTSEAITGAASGTVGQDTIDTSTVAQFAIQVKSVTTPGASTVQVEQTFDGVNWASLGSPVAIALGTIIRFPVTNGPYGEIRIKVIDAAAAVVVTFVVVGFG